MTILQTLDRAASIEATERETRAGSAEFCKLARCLIAADGGRLGEAIGVAQRSRAKERVVGILKSAIQPGTIADWGALADYQIISAAFSESLRNLGAFDAMLPVMTPAPLRSRGVTITTGITGSSPSERSIKPISSIAFGSALVEPLKATATIVTTTEVARSADANTNRLFDSELRKGCVAAIDSVFLAALIASTTPTASSGSTLANVVTDLGVLLSAVTTGANSRLYYVTSPANMKKLVLKSNTIGAPAFPALGPTGGEIMPSITAIASDQIPSGAAILVDATQLAGSADAFRLDATEQAVVQLDTAPDSPAIASTTMLSLFQTDHRALRAERFFGFVVLRSSAAASLSGVAY